jgi:hypothetical protein
MGADGRAQWPRLGEGGPVVKRLLLRLFGLRRPIILTIPIEVLHEAAEVQRMFLLIIYGLGRPDFADRWTFRQFAGIDTQIRTGK